MNNVSSFRFYFDINVCAVNLIQFYQNNIFSLQRILKHSSKNLIIRINITRINVIYEELNRFQFAFFFSCLYFFLIFFINSSLNSAFIFINYPRILNLLLVLSITNCCNNNIRY